MITSSYPVLMCSDVGAARAYYEGVLGFRPTFEAEWYVSLEREGHELALLDPDHPTIPEGFRGRAARGLLVNLEVEDVDAFHRGLPEDPRVRVVLPLRTEEFGQRHFILAAPDGVLVDVITPLPPQGEYVEQYVGETPSAAPAADPWTGMVRSLPPAPAGVRPDLLSWQDLRAHAITRADLHDDVQGINASLDLIRRTRGGSWPTGPVTAEGNYVDLVWHEAEFRDGTSYTYVLRDDRGAYLGCLYLYPMGRRTPLTPELAHHDVDVSWWVTPTAYAAGRFQEVREALDAWLRDPLWFASPYVSNLESSSA